MCLALSYNSQLSCVLSSCPLCVCSYQQRSCPKRLVSYSSSLLLGLLPQQKLLPKPTLRSFSCCRCRVGCAVAQNFVRKRRLPATQQHFSPFCLLNHSTSFLPTRIPLSFVDLVCCHTFQRHVRRNFYVPGHIWSQRYIWCRVSKND